MPEDQSPVRVALNDLAKATKTSRWDGKTANIFESVLLGKFDEYTICKVLRERLEKDSEMPKLPALIALCKAATPGAKKNTDEESIEKIINDWIDASLERKADWLMCRFMYNWKCQNDFKETPQDIYDNKYQKYLGQLYAIEDDMEGKDEREKRRIWTRYFPRFETVQKHERDR